MGDRRKGGLRGEEEHARRIIQKALGKRVTQNDNGTVPSMYDLRIGLHAAPEVAIEVVGAVNPLFTETWNMGPAKGSLTLDVEGNWGVTIAPGAPIKKLKHELARVLGELKDRGIMNLRVDHYLERVDEALFRDLSSFRIEHVSCSELPGVGRVYLGMNGPLPDGRLKRSTVPEWIGDFLREPAQADVLSKLERSGAQERHVFVVASLLGLPYTAEYYFIVDPEQVPSQAPDLPDPVTAVWIIHGLCEKGLYWDGTAWQFVVTRGEGIEGPPPG